ncbi:hypothetical protein TNCT_485871 [Trichonephila clavata]|uniref:Uncharacterized protein n=1 Tax=Trichonephila clavata TaxID=2740835 RepID=A0A8X6H5E7_TRICU|nr:hypothetical protein TNCT_485871 [Trichonephila clavata]
MWEKHPSSLGSSEYLLEYQDEDGDFKREKEERIRDFSPSLKRCILFRLWLDLIPALALASCLSLERNPDKLFIPS